MIFLELTCSIKHHFQKDGNNQYHSCVIELSYKYHLLFNINRLWVVLVLVILVTGFIIVLVIGFNTDVTGFNTVLVFI